MTETEPTIETGIVMDDIMTQIEQDKVIAFMNDDIMRESVRKFLFASMYENGCIKRGQVYLPRKNWANFLVDRDSPGKQSDESLGQELRAYSWATNMVESAFDKMSELKPVVAKKQVEGNPAL